MPLRAQALVPFALALALVVALAAIGAALVARSAVERELRAQAGTARHLVGGQLDAVRSGWPPRRTTRAEAGVLPAGRPRRS